VCGGGGGWWSLLSRSPSRRRSFVDESWRGQRRRRNGGRVTRGGVPARSGRPEAASLHEPGESRNSNSDPGRERQPPAAAQPAACRDDCRQQAASEQQVEDRTRRRGATYKVADARGHGRRLQSGRQHAERPRRVWLPVDRLLSSPVRAFDRRERRRLTSCCEYASSSRPASRVALHEGDRRRHIGPSDLSGVGGGAHRRPARAGTR
jgi:hypothetical protein